MRFISAPLMLVAARARRRPARWLLPVLGIAVAAGFGGAVAANSAIVADKSARYALDRLSALDRTVRATWQGPATPAITSQGSAILRGLGLRPQTDVVLMNPVRLSGTVVRPAAIAPLDRWVAPRTRARLGPCLPSDCPVLLAGGPLRARLLSAAGVHLRVVGTVRVPSAVPLGFAPTTATQGLAAIGSEPVVLTDDPSGLDSLPGLSGVYRSRSWLAPLAIDRLHSWQLDAVRRRFQRTQAALLGGQGQFSLTAPFDGLDQARAEATAAPQRLLLVGGGALAALALFVILAAGGLRRDQRADGARLRTAGARTGQRVLFVLVECAWLCGAALLVGAALAAGAAAVLATAAGEPAGAILGHTLLTPTGALLLLGGWVAATALSTASSLAEGPGALDLLAIAALAALTAAVLRGAGAGGSDPLPVLLAPLCCLAAGIVTFRAAGWLLQGGERVARHGPVTLRLALIGLARSPGMPALAIAVIAVCVGLGGFALAYRATLLRGTADQAADRVPLDAIVSPGQDFATPLQVAPLARWGAIAGGAVLPVRRTDATYASGGGTVTVPALGIPASALPLLHGWRTSDGSAPLDTLAYRLRPRGAVRNPGPTLSPNARALSLHASSRGLAVSLSADLRGRDGVVKSVALGSATAGGLLLRAAIPAGNWELAALELDEPSGLEITAGHQNAENPAATSQFSRAVNLGPMTFNTSSGQRIGTVPLGAWRAVGAASAIRRGGAGVVVSFAANGMPGIIRPTQPSDVRPVPVLVDPATAASAGRSGDLALAVDGLPVSAHVVGVLKRFPTLSPDAAGFVVADQPTLSAALDGQLPGQGRPDELWLATPRLVALRAALAGGPLAQLALSVRADIERQLRAAPIARGVLGTLVAATALCAALAVLGLLVALLGGARDDRVERDLEAQGVGPSGLRMELRVRMMLAGILGVIVGLAVAVILTTLTVASVRAGTVSVPRPPLVAVVPLLELAGWGAGAVIALAAASWLATVSTVYRPRARRARGRLIGRPAVR